MRKVLLALGLALLAVTPQANQTIDYNTLVANQSGNFTWVGSAPSGSTQLVDYAHYKTYVQNKTCAVTNNAQIMDWNAVISCALTHTASQQSESVSGNYHTVTYSARFNSLSGLYTCIGPSGSDGYNGTPITLPAGTVAPGSSTPLRLNITSIAYTGSTSLHVALLNPSGSTVQTWSSSTSTLDTGSYTTTGAAGSWSWVITQSGGSDGACDSVNGVTAFGGTQITWSGTATWFQ